MEGLDNSIISLFRRVLGELRDGVDRQFDISKIGLLCTTLYSLKKVQCCFTGLQPAYISRRRPSFLVSKTLPFIQRNSKLIFQHRKTKPNYVKYTSGKLRVANIKDVPLQVTIIFSSFIRKTEFSYNNTQPLFA